MDAGGHLTPLLVALLAAAGVTQKSAYAQESVRSCLVLCAPSLNVEPTLTIENLFARHRVENVTSGAIERVYRAVQFEIILALDVSTTIPRLGSRSKRFGLRSRAGPRIRSPGQQLPTSGRQGFVITPSHSSSNSTCTFLNPRTRKAGSGRTWISWTSSVPPSAPAPRVSTRTSSIWSATAASPPERPDARLAAPGRDRGVVRLSCDGPAVRR